MDIQQGAIFTANLNPVKGHEQSGFRPVIILQNNILNKNLNTVVIAPLSKNLQAKGYLTTYFLVKSLTKLDHDSVALLFQIRTIDKIRLKNFISKLHPETFRDLKKQLAIIF